MGTKKLCSVLTYGVKKNISLAYFLVAMASKRERFYLANQWYIFLLYVGRRSDVLCRCSFMSISNYPERKKYESSLNRDAVNTSPRLSFIFIARKLSFRRCLLMHSFR